MVPLVDSKVVVAGDGDNGWQGYHGVGVGCDVGDGGVGQELHQHTHVFLHCREHQRGLAGNKTKCRVLKQVS